MACSAERSAISGLVSVRRLLRMFAARPGSVTNGYAFPLAAAWTADLLTAGAFAALVFPAPVFPVAGFFAVLPGGRLAPSCGACFATRQSLTSAAPPRRLTGWNVGG